MSLHGVSAGQAGTLGYFLDPRFRGNDTLSLDRHGRGELLHSAKMLPKLNKSTKKRKERGKRVWFGYGLSAARLLFTRWGQPSEALPVFCGLI